MKLSKQNPASAKRNRIENGTSPSQLIDFFSLHRKIEIRPLFLSLLGIAGALWLSGVSEIRSSAAQEVPTPSREQNSNGVPARAQNSLRVEKEVVFRRVDEEEIKADLYRPSREGQLPAVVMIHGGGWVSGDKWNVADHAREMALSGFVVMAINYRLAPKHRYPAQLDDCRHALTWMVEHREKWGIDLERVGVWGYSAGAQLAAMLCLKPDPNLPRPKCCVAGGTPCDLTTVPEKSWVLAGVFGATRQENPQAYLDASPIHFVGRETPPTFLFHGTTDLLVPVQTARDYFKKLREFEVPAELYEIDGQGHLITFMHPTARSRAIEFLQRELQQKPPPSIDDQPASKRAPSLK